MAVESVESSQAQDPSASYDDRTIRDETARRVEPLPETRQEERRESTDERTSDVREADAYVYLRDYYVGNNVDLLA